MSITIGMRVMTNEVFTEKFKGLTHLPWRGKVVEKFTDIEGCWKVTVDGVEPIQFVHEDYLTEESS